MPPATNPSTASSASRIYGHLQTAILFAFAVVVFFGPGRPLLLLGKIPTIAGSVLCALGLLLLFIAFRSLGRSIQIAPEPRADATLVTSGIYRWFRHPIYTAILLIVIGIFLRRPTPFIGIAALAVIIFLAVKVQFEEKLLEAHYPTYAAYKSRSWGLIPWPRSSK